MKYIILIFQSLPFHIKPLLKTALMKFVASKQLIQQEETIFVDVRHLILLVPEVELNIVFIHDFFRAAA